MRFFRVNLQIMQNRGVAQVSAKPLAQSWAKLCLTLSLVLLTVFSQGSSRAQDSSAAERFRRNELTRLSFAQNGRDGDEATKSLRKGRDLIEDEKWQEAEQSFKGFIAGFPRHKNVDAAFYWMAFALKKQGRLQDADRALEQLIKEHPKSGWSDDAQAMRVEMAPQLGNQTTINEAMDESRAKGDDEMKLIALQSLMFSNPERAMPVLQDILKADSKASKKLKHAAIALLGQKGNAQTVDMLMEIARNQAETDIGHTAIFWLGTSGDERGFEYLKELVTTGKDKSRIQIAITAIAQSRNPKAQAFLSEMARSAPSPEARRAAIMHLGTQGGEAGFNELLNLYDSESDVETKKQLLTAIAIGGQTRGQGKLLEIARNDTNVELRKTAAFWFAQQGGEKAVETVMHLYDSEQNVQVKEHLIFVMSQSTGKSAMRKLMEIARSGSSVELRKKAIFWLGQSRDPEARKFIEELIK
jgi:HEAT repeat protein